jgi:hypothetical protein
MLESFSKTAIHILSLTQYKMSHYHVATVDQRTAYTLHILDRTVYKECFVFLQLSVKYFCIVHKHESHSYFQLVIGAWNQYL